MDNQNIYIYIYKYSDGENEESKNGRKDMHAPLRVGTLVLPRSETDFLGKKADP